MADGLDKKRYGRGARARGVAFVRLLGTVVLASTLAAIVVALQHFYLWLGLHWDFQPACAFLCFYVAVFGVLGGGLLRRQSWAREGLSTICSFFIFALLVYTLIAGPVGKALGMLIGALCLRTLLNHDDVKDACHEPTPKWIPKYYTYSLCSIVAVGMLYPFFWMVSASLKRPEQVFSSQSLIPKQHSAKVDGREVDVTYTKRSLKFEVVPAGSASDAESEMVFRSAVHAEYPWYLPARARFYTLSKEGGGRRYFSIVRRYANVRVVDKRIRKGDPLHRRRMDVPMSDITVHVSPRWKNFYGTDEHGYPCGATQVIPMSRFFLNSLYIAVLATFGNVLTCSLAGYAFARLKFPGRDKLFLGYLATMMIPGTVTMIPCFILVRMLGWLDTHIALIVPAMFGSAGGTFLLRQFFMGVPKEIEDAAVIDGCGRIGVYWHIMLPMSMPAMVTLTLFSFTGNWGSFMWPLIILNTPEKMTLPVGLNYFLGLHGGDYNLLMAGSLIAIIPMIVIFIVGQKFFIRGIRIGAVKG